ncbi:MAG: hypothetical protein J2P56_06070 [Verrucomicrobia bacterium]|nr:hypothetical protein [Verrucomicrobiota bacterium]
MNKEPNQSPQRPVGRVLRFCTLIGICSFLLLCSPNAYAHGEDYIDETLVYDTLERGAVEPGYWFDIGRDDSGHFMRHNVVLEYGITDHWMIDARATGIDEDHDGFHFDSSRLETRYRFFDADTLPVDIAVSGEINSRRDEESHQIFGIEPRLILSKDFGKLNVTLNLATEIPFNRHSPTFEARGGCEYDVTDFFHVGTELRYDTEEHAVGVIPQIRFTFPHRVTLKAGYSYDFGATHERFLRVAFVAEF